MNAQPPDFRQPRPLGSLLFYLGYLLSMGFIGAPLALLAWPLPIIWRFRLLNLHNRFVVFWLGLTCGIRYRIEGEENLPAGAYVMIANHQSEWETIFLQMLHPPLCTVLKRELLRIPIFGWALRLLRPIAVDRSQPARMLKMLLKVGTERLQAGLSVLIFPEGTRVAPGKRKLFSKSAAMIALRAGVPVVPVAHNAGEHWGRGDWVKHSGRLQVRIGAPIQTQGLNAEEITRQAQWWIEQALVEISAVPRPTEPPLPSPESTSTQG